MTAAAAAANWAQFDRTLICRRFGSVLDVRNRCTQNRHQSKTTVAAGWRTVFWRRRQRLRTSVPPDDRSNPAVVASSAPLAGSEGAFSRSPVGRISATVEEVSRRRYSQSLRIPSSQERTINPSQQVHRWSLCSASVVRRSAPVNRRSAIAFRSTQSSCCCCIHFIGIPVAV